MSKIIKLVSYICAVMVFVTVCGNLALYSKQSIARSLSSKGERLAQVEPAQGAENEQIFEFEIETVSEEPPEAIVDVETSLDIDEDLTVQTVLTPFKAAVISAPLDGVIEKIPYESGDTFKKGAVLVKYKCEFEEAKVLESQARVRSSNRQLKAFNRLKKLDTVSDVEYVSMKETNRQERAVLAQAQARLNLCTIRAPFDGRVQEKSASNFESTKSGRVLMEISSSDPLQAEFLVPSTWLRWLNKGTDLSVYIVESDKSYPAEVIRINGQVDPITQTIRIVSQIKSYHEELLPGMSGNASFQSSVTSSEGFMGLKIGEF